MQQSYDNPFVFENELLHKGYITRATPDPVTPESKKKKKRRAVEMDPTADIRRSSDPTAVILPPFIVFKFD